MIAQIPSHPCRGLAQTADGRQAASRSHDSLVCSSGGGEAPGWRGGTGSSITAIREAVNTSVGPSASLPAQVHGSPQVDTLANKPCI